MHRIAVYLRMDIWRQIREDREKGAERLVSEYGNRLFAAAILLCGNEQDAEELTFRTLDQAVKKIRLYDAKKSFFTWLYAILLNFHRMNHRRRRVETVPMGTAEDLPEVVADTFGAAISQTADDTVAGAVRFRIRLLALAALVAAASALTVGLMGRTAPSDAGCASIIATQGHRGDEKISGWMLLSVFRDIFRRNKANKRKEEE